MSLHPHPASKHCRQLVRQPISPVMTPNHSQWCSHPLRWRRTTNTNHPRTFGLEMSYSPHHVQSLGLSHTVVSVLHFLFNFTSYCDEALACKFLFFSFLPQLPAQTLGCYSLYIFIMKVHLVAYWEEVCGPIRLLQL